MAIHLPNSLPEALAMLADLGPDALPVAGGTDLYVHWRERFRDQARPLVDLSGLAELRRIEVGEREIVLGAGATYWQTLRDERLRAALPLLADAARQVGAIQIQARGTWGGNLVNASPAADGVPVLMAYDGVLELASKHGVEEVAVADLYLGYKELRRRPDQLVVAIRLPRREHDVEWFAKVGARAAQAITKVGVAVTHSAEGWRVVANSMAATVRRCPALEHLLAHEPELGSPDDLLPAIRRDLSPIDDLRSTAAYREQVLARLLFHGLAAPGSRVRPPEPR